MSLKRSCKKPKRTTKKASNLRANSRSQLTQSKKLNNVGDGIGRLFIDPASISSGWAYFKGLELVSHGTISTNAKSSIFDRLSSIWVGYRHLDFSGPIQEVHIEKLPRRCHHYTMWSVGVIGHALTKLTLNIKDDVPVKSWQKHANWQRESDVWKRLGYSSEDEFAAICMGYWYIGGLS